MAAQAAIHEISLFSLYKSNESHELSKVVDGRLRGHDAGGEERCHSGASLSRAKARTRNPVCSFTMRNQTRFRINFVSLCEDKIVGNDTAHDPDYSARRRRFLPLRYLTMNRYWVYKR
jgi:hypothetical protein